MSKPTLRLRAQDTLTLTLPFRLTAAINSATDGEITHPSSYFNSHGAELYHLPHSDRVLLPPASGGPDLGKLALKAGKTVELWISVPRAYYDALTVGERYELRLPALASEQVEVLNAVQFTAAEESEPWPERERVERSAGWLIANQREERWRREKAERERAMQIPKMIGEDERCHDAPIFSVKIEGERTTADGKPYEVRIRYTHHSNQESRPVTFREIAQPFIVLMKVEKPGSLRRVVEEDDETCVLPLDPDAPHPKAKVGTGGEFHTLLPGESVYGKSDTLFAGDREFEERLEAGAEYVVRFVGGKIDWWKYGEKEEHAKEEVGWWEKVELGLVVPASGELRFTCVE